ncbi:allantoinase [Blastomyces silverae]|uniref:Allantoinase n=1 Tax=Blastomyces silverae TaxID=2060906 RepID=A0A0H1BML7_9EURO|nr:allantoinase [Blastomyces silverae]
MPLNAIPPTTTVDGLREKIAAAAGKCWVDLKGLVKAGVKGFKGFLIDSGVDEFPAVSPADIKAAMLELADLPTTLMFHAEMIPDANGDTSPANIPSPTGAPTSYSTFLSSRPATFETTAISTILSLAHLAPKLPLHIVHLSAMEAIPLLKTARSQGINITAETCFHYLSLAAEEVSDGDTRHKCCPPIRSQMNQDALWEELAQHADAQGVIKTVEGNFLKAWGGISSVGLGLPILWTELERRRSAADSTSTDTPTSTSSTTSALEDIVQWCCANTAKQVGLASQKGDLSVGYDGDVCVFDETGEWVVQPDTMLFRNKCSPYQGRKLKGVVRETWLRGQRVYTRDGGFVETKPVGKLLLEPRAA